MLIHHYRRVVLSLCVEGNSLLSRLEIICLLCLIMGSNIS